MPSYNNSSILPSSEIAPPKKRNNKNQAEEFSLFDGKNRVNSYKNRNRFMNSSDIHAILFSHKESSDSDCNNVTQLLSRLKKKIYASCKETEYFIENRYGAGYKILLAKK